MLKNFPQTVNIFSLDHVQHISCRNRVHLHSHCQCTM
jgi:hypothetical protein